MRAAVLLAALALAGCGAVGLTSNRVTTPQLHATAKASSPCVFDTQGFKPLHCWGLSRRIAPPGTSATARDVGLRAYIVRFQGRVNGYAIWQRHGEGWNRLYRRVTPGLPPLAFAVGEVNQDSRPDVLVQQTEGSGGCGPRRVLAVGRERVTDLFHRYACEEYATLSDGLLYFREPIISCHPGHAHCHGGVRITIRGWTGTRISSNSVIRRCFLPHCRRPTPRQWAALHS